MLKRLIWGGGGGGVGAVLGMRLLISNVIILFCEVLGYRSWGLNWPAPIMIINYYMYVYVIFLHSANAAE